MGQLCLEITLHDMHSENSRAIKRSSVGKADVRMREAPENISVTMKQYNNEMYVIQKYHNVIISLNLVGKSLKFI